MKPVMLLDVDGVVNAICKPEKVPNVWPRDTWEKVFVYDMLVTYSTEVIDRLNALVDKVDIQWHTTWTAWGWTEGLAEAIGLNVHTIADPAWVRDSPYWIRPEELNNWWKMNKPVELALLGVPLIWIDDDLYDADKRFFRAATHYQGKHLLIKPHEYTGLCKKHFKLIDQYLEVCT